MLLPSPISVLLLLLLELGGILVTLFYCAELVSSLLVRGDIDNSLLSAGFPSQVHGVSDRLQISQLGEIGFRCQELDDSLHGLQSFSDEHHHFYFTRDGEAIPVKGGEVGHNFVNSGTRILAIRDLCLQRASEF